MPHPTGDQPPPGLGNQPAVRNALRAVGPVLLPGGGPAMVVGLALTGAGYQAAMTRCGAGEQAPAVKDTAHHLSDREGVLDADARFCDACAESVA